MNNIANENVINHGIRRIRDAPIPMSNHTAKRGISDAALRSAKPRDKNYKIAVGGGLYLEVTSKGSKLWRWKYRIDGKENRYAIGSYPGISLKEARDVVESARKQVNDLACVSQTHC